MPPKAVGDRKKAELPHLNVVVIGHVDSGKSTTTGHLIYKVRITFAQGYEHTNSQHTDSGLGLGLHIVFVPYPYHLCVHYLLKTPMIIFIESRSSESWR